MRDIAIKEICKKLSKEHNIDLGDKIALDFFAREGDWQTQYWAQRVKKVYAWEINESFKENLKKNLPIGSEVTIGDSFKLAQQTDVRFGMIVIDNPQGNYGQNKVYCEHFEALPLCLGLLSSGGGLLILNVKTKPFNYGSKELWKQRRNSFYAVEDASELSEEFVLQFYENYFLNFGFVTKFAFLEKRPQESGLSALTVQLERIHENH